MNTDKNPPDPAIEFWIAVRDSDVDGMRKIARAEPELWHKLHAKKEWIVCEAARRSSPEAVRTLIEIGADIDEQDSNQYTGLSWAVTRDRYDVARVLLECGANANIDCPLFLVANSEKVQDRVAMAKLLLDHGADINQPFLVSSLPPRTVLSEALANGHKELVEFLKSRGAKLPAPSPASGKNIGRPQGDYTGDLLAHFRKHYGKPDERVIQEIVPTSDHPIVVYHIPPAAKGKGRVLFTAGMSSCDLNVPEGAEAFLRAELMVLLPKSWPAPPQAIKDLKWAWPVQWLRKIAAYAVDNDTWLGGDVTVLCEEEPPKPLGPGTKFVAWLLLASPESEQSIVQCRDGTRIQLYQLYPLYPEEYQFERERGAHALLKQIVRHKLPEYVDLTRPSVVAGGES